MSDPTVAKSPTPLPEPPAPEPPLDTPLRDDEAAPRASGPQRTARAARSFAALTLFVSLTAILLIHDQVIKHLSFERVAPIPVRLDPTLPGDPQLQIPHHAPVPVVPNVLALRLMTNTGAVFGFFKGGRLFFIVISILAVVGVSWVFARSDAKLRSLHVGLALILSGALGNLIDRVLFAAVRDMFWLFPGVKLPFGWRWWLNGSDELYPWIFNLADVALVVGVALIFIVSLITPDPDDARDPAQANPS